MKPKDLVKGDLYTDGQHKFKFWGVALDCYDGDGRRAMYVFFDRFNVCYEFRRTEIGKIEKVREDVNY